MTCYRLFQDTQKHQTKTRMKCPIRIFPYCHPHAHLDVFVDGKKRTVTLVCSQCDKTMATVKVKSKLKVKDQ